jgi:4'-phosphopantetheinyl transferase
VDIQEETPVEEQLAERFFTADEAEAIKALPDEAARRALFFRMWSVKESFIKLTGQGMKRGLDSFCINWEKGLIEEFSGKELARFRVCEVEPAVHLAVCYYA